MGDAGGAPEGRLQADGAGVVPLGGGGDELVGAPRAATTTMAMDEGQSLAQVQVVGRLAREAAWRAVDARAAVARPATVRAVVQVEVMRAAVQVEAMPAVAVAMPDGAVVAAVDEVAAKVARGEGWPAAVDSQRSSVPRCARCQGGFRSARCADAHRRLPGVRWSHCYGCTGRTPTRGGRPRRSQSLWQCGSHCACTDGRHARHSVQRRLRSSRLSRTRPCLPMSSHRRRGCRHGPSPVSVRMARGTPRLWAEEVAAASRERETALVLPVGEVAHWDAGCSCHRRSIAQRAVQLHWSHTAARSGCHRGLLRSRFARSRQTPTQFVHRSHSLSLWQCVAPRVCKDGRGVAGSGQMPRSRWRWRSTGQAEWLSVRTPRATGRNSSREAPARCTSPPSAASNTNTLATRAARASLLSKHENETVALPNSRASAVCQSGRPANRRRR